MKLITVLFIILSCISLDGLAAEYKPIDSAPIVRMPAHRRSQTPLAKSQPATRQTRSMRQYVGKDGSPLLFGTVEIGQSLNSVPQWLEVISKNANDPIFQLERYFNKSTSWKQLRDSASGKAPMQQLQLINEFWNKWKYIDDLSNWGMKDYWAIPAQFLKKSGDCEDYAIVKYFTLKELGFDPHGMRIVVLKNTITGEGHAVLAVYLNDDVYILDNLSPIVLSHKRISQYAPQFSINEFQRWQHIPPRS